MDISYKDITIVGVVLGWVGSIVALWTNFKNSITKNSDDIKEINMVMYDKNHELNIVTNHVFNDHKEYVFKKIDNFKAVADGCIKCQRNMDKRFHGMELSLNTIIVGMNLDVPGDKVVLQNRRKT